MYGSTREPATGEERRDRQLRRRAAVLLALLPWFVFLQTFAGYAAVVHEHGDHGEHVHLARHASDAHAHGIELASGRAAPHAPAHEAHSFVSAAVPTDDEVDVEFAVELPELDVSPRIVGRATTTASERHHSDAPITCVAAWFAPPTWPPPRVDDLDASRPAAPFVRQSSSTHRVLRI